MGSKKIQYPLSQKELGQSGVAKIILSYNGDLKSEVEKLKKSLKVSQDAFEDLRSDNHKLKSDNGRLQDRLKMSFIPESLKIIFLGCAGYFTNVVASNPGSHISWIYAIGFTFLTVGVIIFQFYRNR